MTEEKKVLLIPKIEHGIVIDHVPAGHGLRILGILHADPPMRTVVVTLGMNLSSRKVGRKDMLKLQTEELSDEVLQNIALVCSGVTVKRIKDFKVDRRFVLHLPETIVGQVRCRNPGCITNHERDVTTRFSCVDVSAKRFKCAFCERTFPLDELERPAR